MEGQSLLSNYVVIILLLLILWLIYTGVCVRSVHIAMHVGASGYTDWFRLL